MKRIKIFVVTKKDDVKKGAKKGQVNITFVYTMSHNYFDCVEYIDRKIILDHKAHYDEWCRLREIDPKNPSSLKEYKKIVLENKNPYTIVKLFYSLKNISCVLRLFNGCMPIGCSYDTKLEVDKMLKAIEAEKQFEEILKQQNQENIEQKA